MSPFVARWIATSVAIAVATLLPGIHVNNLLALIGAALLLGIINAFIRPVLLLLSLPFILFTLGFFILLINTFMFWMVGELVPGFTVHGFWNAFFGSILVSIVSWICSIFFKGSDGKVHVLTHHPRIKQVRGKVIEP